MTEMRTFSEDPARSLEHTSLRLETLIRIRWLAVAGQTLAVLFVHFTMGFELELMACLAFIAISAWLNVFLRLRYPGNTRWSGRTVAALLGYDILQLAALLYLTGGIQNPFSVLLAVPVIVAATTQRVQEIVPLFLLALGAASVLVFFHLPMPWFDGEIFQMPLELKAGIWVALASTMAFTAVYAYRLADESRKLAKALAATELVLQREQFVSNLDGLSAAAAHQLGTPLATISLVSKEMLREIPPETPLHEDAKLLRSQTERCRDILRKIASLSPEEEDVARLPIAVLMQEIIAPHHETDVTINVRQDGEGPAPVTNRNAAVIYGLGNLVENAVDFARSKVDFSVGWDAAKVRFVIIDDGPGFPSGLIERIGEPFISTRKECGSGRTTGGGMGLGLFIAKTLLERSGARLTFSNNRENEAYRGARVEVVFDRAALERG